MTIFSGQTYLEKHRFCQHQVKIVPKSDLELVIVIPCYQENGLLETLNSLENCDPPPCGVEVIVVLNSSDKDSEETLAVNVKTKNSFKAWNKSPHSFATYFLLDFLDLPAKHAGVGLARKIGMDEAVSRFEQAGNPQGIIVCLDADATVHPNYLVQIHQHFLSHPSMQACSIYFEHPLEGDVFESDVYRGIIQYELFLRYYIEGLRYAGHPYAFHTIGSSMAVRSVAYQRQNGMNKRKAGEDFYFLMKFIVDGKLNELNKTCVYPSPRPADHVPFGTGKAIIKWMEGDRNGYPAYDLNIFEELKVFLDQVPLFYKQLPQALPKAIKSYLDKEDVNATIIEIRKHVTTEQAFVKRFYKWFNGLKTLKYVHFARDTFYPEQELHEVAYDLARKIGKSPPAGISAKGLLLLYREIQG